MASIGQYYEAIGRLAVETQSLHDAVEEFTGELISNDMALNQHILAGMFSVPLLKLFKSLFLYRIIDDSPRQSFSELWGELYALFDDRNIFLHSLWSITEDSKGIVLATREKYSRPKKKGSLKRDQVPVKHEEIIGLVGTVRNMKNKVKQLQLDLSAAIRLHKKENAVVNTTVWLDGIFVPPWPESKRPKKHPLS